MPLPDATKAAEMPKIILTKSAPAQHPVERTGTASVCPFALSPCSQSGPDLTLLCLRLQRLRGLHPLSACRLMGCAQQDVVLPFKTSFANVC